ncbi:MAG: hypothetical protein R3E90_07645 [Marinicella sp.]
MNLQAWQTFLGWNLVIHFGLLLLVFVLLTLAKSWVLSVHQKLFNLPKEQLLGIYIQFIAAYKILITVFVLVPYLVIRFIL